MSRGSDREADAERVRTTVLNNLKVHVRLTDQGHNPSEEQLRALAASLPPLSAFSDHRFRSVRVVLDWDHQLPSQYVLLRIFGCYDDEADRHVERLLASRDAEIGEMNLYPEFDLPDYGEIEGRVEIGEVVDRAEDRCVDRGERRVFCPA